MAAEPQAAEPQAAESQAEDRPVAAGGMQQGPGVGCALSAPPTPDPHGSSVLPRAIRLANGSHRQGSVDVVGMELARFMQTEPVAKAVIRSSERTASSLRNGCFSDNDAVGGCACPYLW